MSPDSSSVRSHPGLNPYEPGVLSAPDGFRNHHAHFTGVDEAGRRRTSTNSTDTGGIAFEMAWVSVPALTVTPSRQTYRHVRRDPHPVVNFSDGDFTADIVFDHDGFVLDYPDIGHRANYPEIGRHA
jgi:hypothetical protein